MTDVVDTHVHVWDPRLLRYDWLTGPLDRPMLPADLPGAAEVTAAVFVQAACAPDQGLDEARWVASLDWPERIGIVAFAPLEHGAAVREHLDLLREVPGVVGVRRLLQDEPDAFLQDPGLLAGLRVLAAEGLPFDLCVRWPQLPAAAELLQQVPGLTVVLDHLGKPPVAAGFEGPASSAWRRGLEALLELDDVLVKLSGLAPESDPARDLAEQAAPFLREAAALAGPDRLLLGSDWPVSFVGAEAHAYADWFGLVREVTGLSGSAWAAVASGNARRVYAST